MKHYITLFSLLLASLGFAQTDPTVIIKNVNAQQKKTVAQMKANTNKAKNNALFDEFNTYAQDEFLKIDDDNIAPYVKDYEPTPQFKKLLDENGLTALWLEGSFAGIYFKKGHLEKTFASYLSEDYALYLKINKLSSFMIEDAALIITWKELGDLVFEEGNFIQKYPNSEKINEVKESFSLDLSLFLFGAENTPSHSEPEARKAMTDFVKQHPKALATPLVNTYLTKTKDLVNKKGIIVQKDKYRKLNLSELIEKELKKLLKAK